MTGRQSDPALVHQVWDAIENCSTQRQQPNFERVSKFVMRNNAIAPGGSWGREVGTGREDVSGEGQLVESTWHLMSHNRDWYRFWADRPSTILSGLRTR